MARCAVNMISIDSLSQYLEQQEVSRCEQLEARLREMKEALEESRSELSALAASLMSAQEQEQRRIAREVHDDLGQRAALMRLNLARILSELPPLPAENTRSLRKLGGDLDELAEVTRNISHRLHPSVIADLGLPFALQTLISEQNGREIDIQLQVEEIPYDIPLDVATSLYRIVQECLRNTSKHAAGSVVCVTLATRSRQLELKVEDTGPGFSPAEARGKGGLGLVSMQERARLAGGSFILNTKPGEGTIVLVRLPLAGMERSSAAYGS